MALSPPPSRTEILERDRDRKITGQASAVWVKYFGDMRDAIALAGGAILPIQESDVTDLVSDLAALAAAIALLEPSGLAITSNEIPAGLINDVNTVFTLVDPPAENSLQFFVRGILQEPNVDYTLAANGVTMAIPPATGAYVRAFYIVTTGTSPIVFAGNEIPVGAVNDANTVYTLLHVPSAGSLAYYRQGVLQEVNVDYTLVGNIITVVIPLPTGSYQRAFYQY